MSEDIISIIIKSFLIKGDFISAEPLGHGLINDTYIVAIKRSDAIIKYVIQKINKNVFKNVPALMENIVCVTNYLKKKIIEEGKDYTRETLEVIYTKDGLPYLLYEGEYYRAYNYIDCATSYEKVDKKEHFYESAVAAAKFQRRLIDFDPKKLYVSIENFHDTRVRALALIDAVKKDPLNRLSKVKSEVAFALENQYLAPIIMEKLENNTLPVRVTHNDTKLNNVMIDDITGEGICIIDLDTIMPGSSLFDFGDAIRSGCNVIKENVKASFNKNLYDVYLKGYLSVLKDYLTTIEIELLPISAIIMTYELGLRFLTDYLMGDTYFKIKHSEHNLERTRLQFDLLTDMFNKLDINI